MSSDPQSHNGGLQPHAESREVELQRLVISRRGKKQGATHTMNGTWPYWNGENTAEILEHLGSNGVTGWSFQDLSRHLQAVRRTFKDHVQSRMEDVAQPSAEESRKDERIPWLQSQAYANGELRRLVKAMNDALPAEGINTVEKMLDKKHVANVIRAMPQKPHYKQQLRELWKDFKSHFATRNDKGEDPPSLNRGNIYTWFRGQKAAYEQRKKLANAFAQLWMRVLPGEAPLAVASLAIKCKSEQKKREPNRIFTPVQMGCLLANTWDEWQKAHKQFDSMRVAFFECSQSRGPLILEKTVAQRLHAKGGGFKALAAAFPRLRGVSNREPKSIRECATILRGMLRRLMDLTLILACATTGCRPCEFAYAFLFDDKTLESFMLRRIKLRDELIAEANGTPYAPQKVAVTYQLSISSECTKTGMPDLLNLRDDKNGLNLMEAWGYTMQHLSTGHEWLVGKRVGKPRVAASSRVTSAGRLFRELVICAKQEIPSGKWDVQEATLYVFRKTLITVDHLDASAAKALNDTSHELANTGRHTNKKTILRHYMHSNACGQLWGAYQAMWDQLQAAKMHAEKKDAPPESKEVRKALEEQWETIHPVIRKNWEASETKEAHKQIKTTSSLGRANMAADGSLQTTFGKGAETKGKYQQGAEQKQSADTNKHRAATTTGSLAKRYGLGLEQKRRSARNASSTAEAQ